MEPKLEMYSFIVILILTIETVDYVPSKYVCIQELVIKHIGVLMT